MRVLFWTRAVKKVRISGVRTFQVRTIREVRSPSIRIKNPDPKSELTRGSDPTPKSETLSSNFKYDADFPNTQSALFEVGGKIQWK